MKKLVVNTENCIGCGACVGIDSKHFDFNEDGLSYVISQEDLDLPSVTDAVESCPVQVLSLEEAEEAVSNVIPFPENKEDISSEVEIDENEKAA